MQKYRSIKSTKQYGSNIAAMIIKLAKPVFLCIFWFALEKLHNSKTTVHSWYGNLNPWFYGVLHILGVECGNLTLLYQLGFCMIQAARARMLPRHSLRKHASCRFGNLRPKDFSISAKTNGWDLVFLNKKTPWKRRNIDPNHQLWGVPAVSFRGCSCWSLNRPIFFEKYEFGVPFLNTTGLPLKEIWRSEDQL